MRPGRVLTFVNRGVNMKLVRIGWGMHGRSWRLWISAATARCWIS